VKITGYVSHSDLSRHDTGWRHPEHQGRLPAVARAVYRDMLTLFDPLLEIEAVPATEADLALAHDAGYVAAVRARVDEAAAAGTVLPLGGEVMVSGASWDAAVAAAGAGITAVEAVVGGAVRNAFCAIRPPGSGAGRATQGGFSIFNNAAIAALHLRRRGISPVLLLELGARPGLGSAEILADEPGVVYRAVFQRSLLPAAAGAAGWGTGVGDGARVDAISAALLDAIDSAAADLPPAFLLLSLGCDALAGDPLGGLALEPVDYHRLTTEVRARADVLCEGRLVSLLEGGYDPPRTGAAVVEHLRALAGLPPAAAGQ
jgi:acetoin utilization deacetylase AcuC-like enzyme